MISESCRPVRGGGEGVSRVTYPGPQGIIGASRSNIVSSMQFKRTCTTDVQNRSSPSTEIHESHTKPRYDSFA